jgi:hypothetical protein
LLWLAIIVGWVRSYWRADQIVWQHNRELPIDGVSFTRRQTDQYVVMAGRGGICLGMRQLQAHRLAGVSRWEVSRDPSYPQPWGGTGGAGVLAITGGLLTIGGAPTTLPANNFTFTTLSLSPATATVPSTLPTTSTADTLTLAVPMTRTGTTQDLTAGTMAAVTGGGSVLIRSDLSAVPRRIGGGGAFTGATLIATGASRLGFPPPPILPTGDFQFCMYVAGKPIDLLGRGYVLIFPFWSLLALMTVPLLLALRWEVRGRRRLWRERHGCCLRCGYDLRASPERCPECGAVPASPAIPTTGS